MPRKVLVAYKGLNALHRRYVDLVLEGLSGTAAVRKIKPHLKRPELTAYSISQRNDVIAAFKERQKIDSVASIQRVKRMDEEIDACAFYDPLDYYETDPATGKVAVDNVGAFILKPLNDIPKAARAAIQGISYDKAGRPTLKLADKAVHLGLIAKRERAIVEQHEHAGLGGGPIKTQDQSLTDEAIATRLAFLLIQGMKAKFVSSVPPGLAAISTSTSNKQEN